MHICSFTNAKLIDLKKSLRHENGVLYAISINPKVSTWDMSENPWLCKIIESLEQNGLILPVKEPYPWHKWEITDKGRQAILTLGKQDKGEK